MGSSSPPKRRAPEAEGPPTVAEIRQAFASRRLEPTPFHDRPKKAAVALILAGPEDNPALCLIRRAEHERDPWSGHMALPGGRAQEGDDSPRAAAERETLEEVGLMLRPHQFLGELAEVPVFARGRDTDMVLFAFAYYLGAEQPPFSPNRLEVAEGYWAPLAHLLHPGNRGEISIQREGQDFHLPTVTFEGETVWGVTYRIFSLFAEALSRPIPLGPLHPRERGA